MKPSVLEIRRVQAQQDLAVSLATLITRLDEIEAKLDKALAVKAAKASPAPVSVETEAKPK